MFLIKNAVAIGIPFIETFRVRDVSDEIPGAFKRNLFLIGGWLFRATGSNDQK